MRRSNYAMIHRNDEEKIVRTIKRRKKTSQPRCSRKIVHRILFSAKEHAPEFDDTPSSGEKLSGSSLT